MRRALILLLPACLLLHACTAIPAPSPPPPPPLRVGLVTSPGSSGEGSFNAQALAGVRQATEAAGGEFTVLESSTPREIGQNVEALIAQGYSHIVTVGPAAADATALSAGHNRDVTFSIVDFSFDPALPNVQGLIFREDQAGYLAGALAGMVSQSRVIGVVAGRDVPHTRKYVNGFAQGALAVCQDCRVWIAYLDSADDEAGAAAAVEQRIAAGADVIFGVDGLTAQAALRRAAGLGALVIGAETDAYLTAFDGGPGARVLTSAVVRVDVAVGASIEARQGGTFAAGTLVFDASNGGVGLAPFHEADGLVSEAMRSRLAEIESGLAAGRIETGVNFQTGYANP
jgi:basic membrane protein A and related proteins